MTQTVAVEAHLGPAHTGKTVEYRVLQIDGSTEDVAWTATDVVETSVSGNYRIDNGVVVQDAGGYVEFRESGPDTVLATLPVDPAAPTAVQVRTEMDSNSTQLSAIVGDTNELQADWADGGRLDTILDAVPTAAEIDTELTSSHGSGAWTTADVSSLPTAAEIDTELTSTHGAGSWVKIIAEFIDACCQTTRSIWNSG